MTSRQVGRVNQQSKGETSLVSGVLQRAAVRPDAEATQEDESGRLRESWFVHDFSQVPIGGGGLPKEVSETPNQTGLPDNLKAGVENLSGYSLDDVRVHYNSPKPAQLQALAYTQGTDIHVAPGQEKHLPHEAWHVVQQMQARVKPTMQMKRIQINDEEGLEREADTVANQALQTNFKERSVLLKQETFDLNFSTSSIVQRVKIGELDTDNYDDFVKVIKDATETKNKILLNRIYIDLNNYVKELDFDVEDQRDPNIFKLLSITKQAIVKLEEAPKIIPEESKILALPKSEWWRLFIDTRYHEKTEDGLLFDYEQSPGFYNAMLTAFEEVFSPIVPKEPEKKSFLVTMAAWITRKEITVKEEEIIITAKEYKQYHEKVRKTVLNKINSKVFMNIASGWSGIGVDFAMNELGKYFSTPSSEALKELIEEGIITLDPKSALLEEEADLKTNPEAIVEVKVIMNEETGERLFRCFTNYKKENSEQLVNKILQTYYDEIRQSKDNVDEKEQHDKVLKAIARVIRNLHVGHFFPDANGRINIMLLLNKFLMENNMEPVILTENPGVFGGLKTLDELVAIIKAGMENFKYAVEHFRMIT